MNVVTASVKKAGRLSGAMHTYVLVLLVMFLLFKHRSMQVELRRAFESGAVAEFGSGIGLEASQASREMNVSLHASHAMDMPLQTPQPVDVPVQMSHHVQPPPETKLKNLYYLRLHKTGSTTIGGALKSYAMRNNLTVADDEIRRREGDATLRMENTTPERWDALISVHSTFNLTKIRTYLHSGPDVIFTSIRLPLQRQLSWFRQQNTDYEIPYETKEGCEARRDEVLARYDEWYESQRLGSLTVLMAEPELRDDLTALMNQYDFIFIMERLRDSYECLCKQFGIRLCNDDEGVAMSNVKPAKSCTKELLARYRSRQMLSGCEKDLLIYERANSRITQCLDDGIPEYCQCERGRR